MLQNRIRELRKREGITQAQLAKILGISTSAVGMYEQGRREPAREIIGKLCAYFHVSSDYLLETGGEEAQKDLNAIIDQMRESILRQDGLMFKGAPVEQEDKEKIVDAIELGISFVLEQRQKKQQKK